MEDPKGILDLFDFGDPSSWQGFLPAPLVCVDFLRKQRKGKTFFYVYELLENNRVIYVGYTHDPWNRLAVHLRSRKKREISLGDIVECIFIETAIEFERYAIDSLKPPENYSDRGLSSKNYMINPCRVRALSRDASRQVFIDVNGRRRSF